MTLAQADIFREDDKVKFEKNPPLSPTPQIIDIRGKHGTVMFLDPRRIIPLRDNPRRETNPGFTPESISDLARSIAATGQIESAKVCLTNKLDYDAQLIDGERRYRACLHEGLMIRVEIREDIKDDADLYLFSVASNFGKEGHTCLEIADAIRIFKEERRMNVQAIADIFGKSTPWVYQYLSILKLAPEVQELLVSELAEMEESISPSVEKSVRKRGRRRDALLSFSLVSSLCDLSHEIQKTLAFNIVRKGMSLTEARRYIFKHRDETGQHKRQTGRQKEKFVSFEGLVISTINKFGIFEDMKSIDVLEFLSKRDIKELRTLLKELNGLVRSVSSFEELVQRSVDDAVKKLSS